MKITRCCPAATSAASALSRSNTSAGAGRRVELVVGVDHLVDEPLERLARDVLLGRDPVAVPGMTEGSEAMLGTMSVRLNGTWQLSQDDVPM